MLTGRLGYTRILGEIQELTSRKVSWQFVVNVMREHGFEPGPKRGKKTWAEFLSMHAKTLWQRDFFSKKVITLCGMREYFLLAFIHVGTRQVIVSPATINPTQEWCRKQAAMFCQQARSHGLRVGYVFHDRDYKYGTAFEGLARHDVKANRVIYRAPNLQAYIERWIQAMEVECPDHVIVLAEKHLNFPVAEIVRHYLTERSHQSLGNAPLVESSAPPKSVPTRSEVACRRSLGGLLRHYHCKAA